MRVLKAHVEVHPDRLHDIDSSIDRPTYYVFPSFSHTPCPNYGQLASVYSEICRHTCRFNFDIRCKYPLQFSFALVIGIL